jgi:TonB-linked SusC/RagA family outer membrane protein
MIKIINKNRRKGKAFVYLVVFLLFGSVAMAQEPITVNGNIIDIEAQAPVIGVNILEEGTRNGTISDFDGNFSIDVAGPDAVLVISFIGYVTQVIPVNGRREIDIIFEIDTGALDEIVVIGYGSTRKSDLTGSVSSVSQSDIIAIPATNALEALQGKVAGLDLTRTSGQAGASLNISIRGNRSLNASNGPLVVVDGIIYGSTLDVNPNDIASVEVLKDASATAIYGTLGANGVILITTKKGKVGDTRVSINSYYAYQDLGGYADIMTGPEWVELRREARRTVGEWSSEEDDAKIFNPTQLENFQNGIYSNWADELIHTGAIQNHQVSLSGGTDKTTYYFSLEYMKEEGLLKNDQLNRYSGRLSVDQQIVDNLKLSTNLQYTLKDQDRRKDPLNQANKMSPLGRPYDDEGNLNIFPVGDSNTLNPLVDEVPGNYVDNERNNRFFGNISLDWSPITNLSFTSRLGIDHINYRRGLFSATNTIETGADGLSLARGENGLFSRTTWENFINYSYKTGNHEFQGLLGQSLWKTVQEEYLAEGRDLASPTMLYNNLGAVQTQIRTHSNLEENQLASFFGRVNYKFDNKYLVTLLMRADGSSVLAPGNKWGYFPSAALGWVLTEEDFLNLRNSNSISRLKLRASYGISGNSAVSPYQTLGGLSRSTYAFDIGNSEKPAYGYYPSLISSPDLRWETTATTNFGLDFGFFANRISGTLDIYQQNTNDLLMQRALPTTSGFSSAWDNIGKTRNRGVELFINTINLEERNTVLGWSSDITFTSNKEEIVKLPGGDRDLANSWFVGSPINSFYNYEKIGIWQLDEAAEAATLNQDPGDIKVRDVDGDGVITPEDRVIIGSTVPDYTLGFNNRFSYEGFELNVFVYARQGQTITSEAAGSFTIGGLANGPRLDYWTPENPTNAYPRPDAGTSRSSAQYYNTLQYVDGSFVKIRDVTLAYNFQAPLLGIFDISRFRVYATAKNYFIFSNLDPYDPERGGNLSFPMTRQLVFGINMEL